MSLDNLITEYLTEARFVAEAARTASTQQLLAAAQAHMRDHLCGDKVVDRDVILLALQSVRNAHEEYVIGKTDSD